MEKIVWESIVLVNEIWEYHEYMKGKRHPTPDPYKVNNRLKSTNNINYNNNKSLDLFIKYIKDCKDKDNNTNTNNTMEFL